MPTFSHFMTHDHRRCDDLFASAERAVDAQAWPDAQAAFTQFQGALEQHFAAEELLLFAAFEEKTGMRMGPTRVMRDEHLQMRALMEAASAALLAHDADDFSGNAETLLIMLQQHNTKEENVLYPMCDQHLADQLPTLLEAMQAKIGATAL